MTSDDALLAALRDVAGRADAPPSRVVEAARAAFTWRTVDAELAELIYDSSADDKELAGLRGPGTATGRLLSFAAGDVTVEVEVSVAAGTARLVGQLVPGQPARVEARFPGGSVAAQADDLGRFTVEAVPAGPLSLRCLLDDGARTVGTDWFVV